MGDLRLVPDQQGRQLDDWAGALELAQLWSGYWEDVPIVHIDTERVGFLARSFLAAYAELYPVDKESS